MSKVDLHIHSNHSDDGEFSVEQLIDMCAKKQMKMVSISDHNSVQGVSKAINLGTANGVNVVSGIEMDCVFEHKNFHLLGYGFDHTNKDFIEIEKNIYKQEMEAASEKINKFKKATNIDINEQEVYDLAENGIITGELIGEIVLNKDSASNYDVLRPYLKGGAKSDMPYVNFYWDFFSEGKIAYVPIRYISLVEAKELIHKSNGIAILAHPGQNLKDDFSFIDKIIREKIDGIEVFSSYHSVDTVKFFFDKAKEFKMITTCGSDFHGKNKPLIEIGDCKLTINEDDIVNALKI